MESIGPSAIESAVKGDDEEDDDEWITDSKSSAPPSNTPVAKAIYPLKDVELEECCKEMKSHVLVRALMKTYRNVAQLTKIRGTEGRSFLYHIADALPHCCDPPGFVLNALTDLSDIFRTNRRNKDLTPRFEKLLAKIIVDAFVRYVGRETNTLPQSPPNKKTKTREVYLISLDESASETRGSEMELVRSVRESGSDPFDLPAPPESASLPRPLSPIRSADSTSSLQSITPPPASTTNRQQGDAVVKRKISSVSLNTNEGRDDIRKDTPSSGDDDDDENNVITLTDLQGLASGNDMLASQDQLHAPETKTWMDIISAAHQTRCLHLVKTFPSPSTVVMLISAFHLEPLLSQPDSKGEHLGHLFVRRLFNAKLHHEAIQLINKLELSSLFSMQDIAVPLLEANDVQEVLRFAKDEAKRDELLDFVNQQLSYVYGAGLEIIPEEMWDSIPKNILRVPPLKRIHDRRFQRDITNATIRILTDIDIPVHRFPFIELSQQSSTLHWLLNGRARQQAEEQDFSLEASENFNGLIERVVVDRPVLRKILVRELVLLDDRLAANHFAEKYGLRDFMALCIQSLSVKQVRPFADYRRAKKRSDNHSYYYELPTEVVIRFVSTSTDLDDMKRAIQQSTVCGMDTEWSATVEIAAKQQTGLMQLAFDADPPVVYLLDMIALRQTGPGGGLLAETQTILRALFSDPRIRKIAYDFNGDQDILAETFPQLSASNTPLNNFLDFKNVRGGPKTDDPGALPVSLDSSGRPVGGLSGLVTLFLKVKLNKKQQLSDWDRRPLTNEQKFYAASDSYSLLEMYRILVADGHQALKLVTMST